MEQEFRDQADGHHSGARASEGVANDRRLIVRFCTWCKEICLRGNWRPTDSLIVYIYGEDRRAFWNGRELIVADGICELCSEKLHPQKKDSAQSPETQKGTTS